MPRKPAPTRRRPSRARRVSVRAAAARRTAQHPVVPDDFYRDLVWSLRNGVLAITRDGRIAV
ncbi:MAG TPA: hypothetical protein VFK20_09245, partial [Vicinamibacterales bacterium]|nr:hypothetical protein [Vicinamibacterales bacterium]